jgi:hypothetical protein
VGSILTEVVAVIIVNTVIVAVVVGVFLATYRPSKGELRFGKGGLECRVDLLEVVGELRHLFCSQGPHSLTLLSREPYNIGDSVKFEVTRYNIYKDGRLLRADVH